MSDPGAIPVCFICGQEDCDHTEDQQAAFITADADGRPAPVLASDPDPKAARRSKARDNREASDLQWLMSHANGRRLMWGLIARCGLFNNSYLSSRTAPDIAMHMAFLEGSRNIGNEYFDLVTKNAKADYFKMLEENKA